MGQDDNAKRIFTTVLWVLAMILPGGLPLMALWMAIKAGRSRAEARRSREPQQPGWVASKATESQIKVVAAAATCTSCPAQA